MSHSSGRAANPGHSSPQSGPRGWWGSSAPTRAQGPRNHCREGHLPLLPAAPRLPLQDQDHPESLRLAASGQGLGSSAYTETRHPAHSRAGPGNRTNERKGSDCTAECRRPAAVLSQVPWPSRAASTTDASTCLHLPCHLQVSAHLPPPEAWQAGSSGPVTRCSGHLVSICSN